MEQCVHTLLTQKVQIPEYCDREYRYVPPLLDAEHSLSSRKTERDKTASERRRGRAGTIADRQLKEENDRRPLNEMNRPSHANVTDNRGERPARIIRYSQSDIRTLFCFVENKKNAEVTEEIPVKVKLNDVWQPLLEADLIRGAKEINGTVTTDEL